MSFVYPRNTEEFLSEKLDSKGSVRSRPNWNLEVLGFVEGKKPENPEKTPRSKDENQQKTKAIAALLRWD